MSKLMISMESVILRRLDYAIGCTLNCSGSNKLLFYKKSASYKFLINKQVLKNTYSIRQYQTNAKKLNPSMESVYARSILDNSEVYSNSFITPLCCEEELKNLIVDDDESSLIEKPWNNMTNEEFLENFKLLSYYAFNSQESLQTLKYSEVREVMISKLFNFNDTELRYLLHYLRFWCNKADDTNLQKLWQTLDDICFKRINNWSIDELFLIHDLLYNLNFPRFSKFIYHSLIKANPNKMTRANLVQYAYLLKLNNKLPIDLERFEYNIEKNFHQLSIEELGIIAMAFFKYETAIKSKDFLIKLIQTLQKNIDNVSDITLAAILKILRYSVDLQIVQQYDSLQKSLISRISHCSLATLTHVAHLKGRTLIHHEELISNLLDRYRKEIESARIKDIERILFILYIFNYDPKSTDFYSIAHNEFLNPDRISEINNYPKSLIYSIMYMLQMDYYPEEILKLIMEQSFLNKSCTNDIYKLDREYLILDSCIELEHPEYNGPRLRKDIRLFLLKRFGVLKQNTINGKRKINQGERISTDVLHTCKKVLNSESAVHVDFCLPHFAKSDIILCYNPQRNIFISPSEKLSKIPLGTLKCAPQDGNKWYVLIIGVHNIMTRNTSQPTGILAVQIRHLKKIGYIPIVIPYFEWHNQLSEKQKMDYIWKILSH